MLPTSSLFPLSPSTLPSLLPLYSSSPPSSPSTPPLPLLLLSLYLTVYEAPQGNCLILHSLNTQLEQSKFIIEKTNTHTLQQPYKHTHTHTHTMTQHTHTHIKHTCIILHTNIIINTCAYRVTHVTGCILTASTLNLSQL